MKLHLQSNFSVLFQNNSSLLQIGVIFCKNTENIAKIHFKFINRKFGYIL